MRTSNLFIGLAAISITLAACSSGSSGATVRLMAGPTFGPSVAIDDLPKLSKVAARSVDFEPIKLTGKRSRTVKVRIPKDVGAIAKISSSGKRDFVVWEVDAEAKAPKLLVNRVGAYKGTVLVNLAGGMRSIKVKASGPWSITIRPALEAKAWDPEDTLKGSGDMVVRLDPPSDGPMPATFQHDGKRSFSVWIYRLTRSELLASGIGASTDDLILPDGSLLLRIEADGKWSVTPG